MKFNKELIQKIFLAAMLACGGLFYYASEMLGPLSTRETKARNEIAALEPKIKEAKTRINRTSAVENGDPHANEARRALEVMRAKIPEAPPVAWFPTRVEAFSKQQGIAKPVFHAIPDRKNPGFPEFEEVSWSIEFSRLSFASLGWTLAGLENQEGLLQITQLKINPVPKEPEVHYAQITISTLVKSEK